MATNTEKPSAQEDDIVSLAKQLSTHHLRYVEITTQTELKHAIARWPLLTELASPRSGRSPA